MIIGSFRHFSPHFLVSFGARLLLVPLLAALIVRAGSDYRLVAFELGVWLLAGFGLHLLTRRLAASYLFAGALSLVLSQASIAKVNILGQKLAVDDLRIFLQDPGLVAAFASHRDIALLASGGLLLLGIFIWERKSRLYQSEVLLAVAAAAYAGVFLKDPEGYWDRMVSKDYGNLAFLISTAVHPARLDLSRCFHMAREDCGNIDLAALAPDSTPAALPNVVFVLLESTFDVTNLKGLSAPESAWHAFAASPLHVHTKGGETWVAEYAVLHGVAPSAYGGAFHHVNILGPGRLQGRIAPALKRMGYDTWSMYPYRAQFYNTETFHASLGLADHVDCEATGTCDAYYWQRDEPMFDLALQRLREANKPQFAFLLTMANHSPHGQRANVPPLACGPHVSQPLCAVISDYRQREDQIQRQIRVFTDQLAQLPRRTVVVFFGDHIPGTVSQIVPQNQFKPGTDFETIFFLYDSQRQTFMGPGCKVVAPVDVADLDAVALNAAGLSSPYVRRKMARAQRRACGPQVNAGPAISFNRQN